MYVFQYFVANCMLLYASLCIGAIVYRNKELTYVLDWITLISNFPSNIIFLFTIVFFHAGGINNYLPINGSQYFLIISFTTTADRIYDETNKATNLCTFLPYCLMQILAYDRPHSTKILLLLLVTRIKISAQYIYRKPADSDNGFDEGVTLYIVNYVQRLATAQTS